MIQSWEDKRPEKEIFLQINKNGNIIFNQINNYNEGKNIVILNSSECKGINYKKDVFKKYFASKKYKNDLMGKLNLVNK